MADPKRGVGLSLQGRLARDLTILILSLGIVATALSFSLAYNDAHSLQDTELKQVAGLYPPGEHQVLRSMLHPRTDIQDDSLIQIWPERVWKQFGIDQLPEGYSDVHLKDEDWRLYKENRPGGEGVAVLQSTDLRDELAASSALQTLLPLLLVIPAMLWLSRRTLAQGFRAVQDTIRRIDRRSPGDVSPLTMATAVQEIQPFVDSINGLLRRAGAEMDRQQRFIADAAHELRTPLAAMTVQVGNLQRVSSLDELGERLAPLNAGLRRMERLVNQLLTLARNQVMSEPVRQPVDFAEVTRDMVGNLILLAREKRIDLGLFAPPSCVVSAQPGELETLTQVLLENAIKYTPPDGRINVSLIGEADRVVLEIEDTGPGIPENVHADVFAPFHRGQGAGGEGSGLGLAIAKAISERYAGEIQLMNRYDGEGRVEGLCARYRHPVIGAGA